MSGLFRWLYRRLTERLYGEWAALYDPVSFAVSLGNWDGWRRRALAYVEGDRVLEIGFGTGHLLAALAGGGRCAVGADASPAMALRGARRLRGLGLAANVVQARAQALPFAAGAFDTVVSTFPAGFILDAATVAECVRATRSVRGDAPRGLPAGRLIVAGLWATTELRPLRMAFLPFYGSPGIGFLSKYVAALRGAGYAAAMVEEATGGFRIGGVVAVRLHPEQ